jgi:hypothetical protein
MSRQLRSLDSSGENQYFGGAQRCLRFGQNRQQRDQGYNEQKVPCHGEPARCKPGRWLKGAFEGAGSTRGWCGSVKLS